MSERVRQILNFKHSLAVLLIGLCLWRCDNLERLPKDEGTVQTSFINYSNFRTYAWSFYDVFQGYELEVINTEWNSDFGQSNNNNNGSDWLWNRIAVPGSSEDWEMPYKRIRQTNIMLDNLEQSELSEADQGHWRSVGYFFRALNYIELLSKFGGTPWIAKALTEEDRDLLFGPRDSRNTVAANLLSDLLFAEANIKADGDGPNSINVHVVRALISRFGLFEATWRKYHQLGGEEPYLNASLEMSEKLMADFTVLHPSYDELFNSENLLGMAGIILFKQYEPNQLTHILTSRHRNSAGNWDLTKRAVDSYLLTDGLTRWNSPLFEGDRDMNDEFRNRDRRLYFTVTPPYSVFNVGNVNNWNFAPGEGDTPQERMEDSLRKREYYDLMKTLSDTSHKWLPDVNHRGLVVRTHPHFRDDNDGQGFNVTRTGYKLFKYFNKILFVQNRDINDAPVFRMGEVLLNYAEARFEQGTFDQSVADMTINKLRERGMVAPFVLGVSEDNALTDPYYDSSIPPVLWEIRRERGVELMYEGFRWNDLRRWRRMNYAAEKKLGKWENNDNHDGRLQIDGGATEGYIAYINGSATPPEFPEHYYLYPLPSDQMVLNPQLEQNPGY